MTTRALERLRKKITIDNLWLYIVKVLIDHGPARAYDVKKLIREKFGFKPATITVYTVIYRMTSEGLLEKVYADGDTLYKPSEKGIEAFNEALKTIETILDKLKS